ncbi:hypothetical protein [Campylobacter hyointestinalis]|nr:hypothetical protein [Campylobacter hyointestinalis]
MAVDSNKCEQYIKKEIELLELNTNLLKAIYKLLSGEDFSKA